MRSDTAGRRRAFLGVIALTLLVVQAPARADTKSEISAAERRLQQIAGEIVAKRSRVASIQQRMHDTATLIRRENASLDRLDRLHARHANDLIDTMAQYDDLHRQMRAVATEAYMRGPMSYVAAMLQAETFADADSALMFTSLVLGRNRELAARTAHAAKQIARMKARDAAMIEQRAAVLLKLRNQRDALLDDFAESQAALEEVSRMREEAAQLLTTLHRRLRAEEEAALGGTMPYGKWAEAFLRSIAAPAARSNLVALVAWQAAEGTSARWNPLATTWKMPGSTSFNNHRVQNYVSLEQGLEATRKTLSRPGHGYESVLANLAAASEAMQTGRAINASDWCRGCADGQYVVELIPTVERYYDRYAG